MTWRGPRKRAVESSRIEMAESVRDNSGGAEQNIVYTGLIHV